MQAFFFPLTDFPLILFMTLITSMFAFGLPVEFAYVRSLVKPAGSMASKFIRAILWFNKLFLYPFAFLVLPLAFFKIWGIIPLFLYIIIFGQAVYFGKKARLKSIQLPLGRYSVLGGAVGPESGTGTGPSLPLHFLFRKGTWERRYMIGLELMLLLPLFLWIAIYN